MLYTRSVGAGHDLVLLHGWGLNAEVWHHIAPYLASRFRVTVVDLPGHGRSPLPSGEFTLETVIGVLLTALPPRFVLAGWSLGGLIAAEIAQRFPERVAQLVLVGANAQFVKSSDWPTAMEAATLQQFARELEHDYAATLQRFLALQARGDGSAREVIRGLRESLEELGLPQPAALRGGLNILRDGSIVSRLHDIQAPTLLLYGRLDMLVPITAAKVMAQRLPNAQLHIFPTAAHAPFISHASEFLIALETFLTQFYEQHK